MGLSTGFFRAAISVLGVLSIVAMPGCGSKTTGSQETAVAPAVVVARVAQRTVPVYGEFVARTDGSATVDLVARVDGFLQSKSFEEGRFVQKGQVLYQIDPLRYQANVQSAKAQLAQAQAQLDKARKDVARCRPLAAAKAIPQQDLDAAIASEMVAQADVQAGQAAVMQAELDLSYCTIRAPFPGLIGKNNVSVGNLVGHGQATVLSTISAINPIKVIFGIPESGFLFLKRKKGKDISTELLMILSDNTPYPEKGRAIFVDRAVDIKTGTLEVQGEFPNPDGLLRPNQFGRIRLAIATAENALLIPQKAVMEQQSTKVVFVVGDDGKVVQRTVSLGPTSESFFIVSEGLKAGERVIVEGQQKARPGMVVTPTEQPLTQEPSSN
jgi:membrane fusion protein (multidrug efflux system)